jgi:hypothetical protein
VQNKDTGGLLAIRQQMLLLGFLQFLSFLSLTLF